MSSTIKRPLVIGHRGAAGEAPENTLASFRLALAQGADGLELDVHLSNDGEIVVCHDATLDRTTDGSGRIGELRLEEIRRCDAGAWFHESFRGERVPVLAEVLELTPPGVLLNIEVKDAEGSAGAIIDPLLERVNRQGRLRDVVFSSFDHKCMRELKRREPTARIGLLYAANLADHAGYAALLGVAVHSLHPDYRLIGRDDVAAAVAAGLCVYPYTVNRIEALRDMIACGVTGIITDFPARLAALLDG
ncbi:glycerophosphodiester phosphodiesterase [Paenibacillus athensensis]|uniref:Glycerophosphodiester phosphodiesterase n=1 Tax=Paenibacillus athensensis TaxID=1967502 RepID=A0A4Y8Q0S5_9BACL|nr:glycerophosphodiester phosphodiesterase family protein [Paenibacillus athensensis]MCD1258296.1 glycerophosphodiester phosphodiesterase [Paenibacillus athensensis]